MKKLGKISINPEKVIKNEELVNLRGGYNNGYSVCVCCSHNVASPPSYQMECDSTGYFQAQFDNCDEAMDWAYYICGSYNINCNSSISCSPLV